MKFSILTFVAMLAGFVAAGPQAPNVNHPEKAANSVGSNNYCNCAKAKGEEAVAKNEDDDDKDYGIKRRMVQLLGPRTCPCARQVDDGALGLQANDGDAVLVADASQVHPNEAD